MKLTNTAIDALDAGKTIRDDAVKGLHVINKNGSKGFYMYYRTKLGDERRPKLGVYGIITLAQARDMGRDILAEVALGNDPKAARDREKGEPTMDALFDYCMKEVWNKGRAWDKQIGWAYNAHVRSRLGKMRVRAVGYQDVLNLRNTMKKSPYAANRIVTFISKMLSTAERLGWRAAGSNPCTLVERFPERKRRRYATPAELVAISRLLDAESERNLRSVAFIYLIMFSGARPSEIAKALPSQIERIEKDGSVHGILRLHGKTSDSTGHDRVVFLPPQAMRVIDKLPKNLGTITGLAAAPTALWARIRKAAGCEDLWARDLRRTFATVGFSAGENAGMVGELLGHQSAQTTKIYAKLMEDPAMASSARIADRMEKLLTSSQPQ
ncbi:integrase family protein [Nitrosovibrio sp. Nv4]|uniref:integrase family protein n=1 Tax=Nitrosovibrio sp. Nv4 TaxID=1945880 RepID=UPI000BD4275E|nr:integrase family protein [Nitrosovibrio sp. Nv4]SOD41303.1 Site-specific recombinase XerD [Nitrosovibrio sp. Nv4]